MALKNRVPKGEGGPWSPGALKFLLSGGARSPIILLTAAPDPFLAVEPGDILSGARSPAFSSLIIRVPRLH